jgi:dienelactone hydrolase
VKLALIFTAVLAGASPNDAATDFALGRWEALYARFAPEMKAAVTMDGVGRLATFGRCRQPVDPPSIGPKQGTNETFIFRIVCEQKTIGLRLIIDDRGLIHGLFFVDPPTGLAVVTGEYRLPAKLTIPQGAGPFPAVVLIHGSGPNDMDETIGPNKPFRDIADGLAAHGIASLRYTKRTRQYKTANITLYEETIQDAVSAASLLKSSENIDPKRVYIIGHSLGAHAAPRIGQADPTLAGLILLAGNTRPLDVIIDEQIEYLGGTPAKAAELKSSISEAYRRDLATNDPVAIARTLKMPMLILQGERDYQVTMEDFKGWETLKGTRVTLKSYPALNHLFQPGQGKSKPSEYYLIAPFSPIVLDDIAAWIKR